uniref:Uncharacterized protein n=1 Tax=Timema douglasi TaxID=61478 RepID=A0A7R8VKX8_TIMDO|nr:unnamed protein product [Timema douglasi]
MRLLESTPSPLYLWFGNDPAYHTFCWVKVIQTFDKEDAVSIREAKVATPSSTVVSDLTYVKSYFGNLPGVIVSLGARDLPLIESVKIMHTIQEGVRQTPGPVASSVATKFEQVLQRNPGWRTMVAVSDILGGQSTPLQEISRKDKADCRDSVNPSHYTSIEMFTTLDSTQFEGKTMKPINLEINQLSPG